MIGGIKIPQASAPKVVVKDGYVWHYFTDGRKPVRVRPANGTAAAGAGSAHLPSTNAPISTPASVQPQVAAPAPEIRDAAFNASLAGLLGSTQNQRDALAEEGQFDETNVKEQLHRLALQRSDSLKNTTDADNKQGLFYSGIHGKRLGDVNQAYNQQDSDQTVGLEQRQQARQRQLGAIGNLTADASSPYGYNGTGGAGSALGELLVGAAERRVASMANDPVAAAPPAATPTAPKAAAKVSVPKSKPKSTSYKISRTGMGGRRVVRR